MSRTTFGVTLEECFVFGGYPGAAPLRQDPPRWRRYVPDALVETAISRDVLLLTRVDKPALLRRFLELARRRPGVDFVVRFGQEVVTIEVKSGANAGWSGLSAFSSALGPTRTLLVGGDGIPVEVFLARPVEEIVALTEESR